MRKVHCLATLVILSLTALIGSACESSDLSGNLPAAATTESRPNIIVILSDDAGYADFGSYGEPEFETPAIDSIAENGIRFTNGYVSASVCSPSRAGLMTGRYQQRFGYEFNLIDEDLGLPISEKTIADYLKKLDYRTGIIGKWHLGRSDQYHPLSRGFDEFVGMLAGWKSYFPYQEPQREDVRLMRQRELVQLPEPFEYYTDFLGQEAQDFILRNETSPFLLYLSFNAVHTPMEAEPEDYQYYPQISDDKRRKLAAMTRSLDRAVEGVIDALKERGLYENTLLFFLNDNGGATNNASDNGILRGMKGSKWEGGIRVPFMIQWPKGLPSGKVYEEPVISLDILPTSLAAATGEPGEGVSFDGVNLLPYLRDQIQVVPHAELFWRRGVAAAVRRAEWKAIRVEANPPLLFNLKQDPGETTNLAKEKPLILRSLLQSLGEWEADLAEPLWREEKKWEINQLKKHRMDVLGREMERLFP